MKIRGIQAEDLYRLVSVADPRLSPDGAKVAFVQTKMEQEKNDYVSNIFVYDLQKEIWTQWTHGKQRNMSPRWSPDGNQLVFVSNRSGKNQLYIMPTSGGEARRVTKVKNGATNPIWSPDGKKIAFNVQVKTGESLELTDQEDQEKEKKKKQPEPVEVTKMKYKADTVGLFTGKYQQIVLLDVETGNIEQLTEGEYHHTLLDWSPDGKYLLFAADFSEDEDFSFIQDIYLLNLETREKHNLTGGKGLFFNAKFSPDGRYVAIIGNDRKYENATLNGLWLYHVRTGELKSISENWDIPVGDYVAADFQQGAVFPGALWNNDGTGIYFTASEKGSVNLYFTDLEGNYRPITHEAGHLFGVSVVDDVAIATASYPVEPSELYKVDLASGKLTKLTTFNEEVLKEIALSEPEPLSYESVDGWTVCGWIMKPVGFEEGKKYPLILEIHGGPHTMYANTYFHEMQMLAAAGFVVLYVNPRGSHGYGQQFVNAVRGDYGGKDYEDLMAAVDYAVETYDFIDESRLGVTGGSYGGFMTNWIVGHTNRFKAAVTQRSISNWISFYGVSDIGYYFCEWQHLRERSDFAGLWEISPLRYVDNIETPLLILHSEEDLRCPIEQAEQLYIALKHRRKTTKFIRFPKSNHELSRSGIPNLRIKRLNYIKDWFETYLQE